MKMKRLVPFLILLAPAALFASAEHGGTSASSVFLSQVVNFSVLFGGLGYLMYKPIKEMFRKRQEGIREELESAARGVEEAEEKRRLSGERLAGVDAEIEKMRGDAARLAEASRAGIKAQAEEEKARLRALADQELQATIKAGVGELRSYLGNKAADAARTRIKSRLTPELHARLIDNSIERLAGSDEEPGTD